MTTALLKTKLYVPPVRTELVPRPRLIERLNAGLNRRLTLISAPAGFGKTTLLSTWLHHLQDRQAGAPAPPPPSPSAPQLPRSPAQAAWLSLDEDDNDPARFLTYLIAALRTAQSDPSARSGQAVGEAALAMLQSPQPPAAEAVLTALINDVAALPGPSDRSGDTPPPSRYLLILDDYHLISEPRIHEGIAFLLEHGPHNLHLAISTRADPPLPIFRLRARGQLSELRSTDLRFTADETATFLNAVMSLNLAPEDVEALEARTEGWVVGLQLAALSLQGRADARAFIAAFGGSHHYVLEYLTQEVVRRQTEPVRRFLMETSILDHLCGPLCDALTGDSDGQVTLADLQRRNLFIVPLDDEHRWYRYHHLFADLLGNLLSEDLPPERIRELHRRASDWHERSGDVDHAIKHALQARELERAASLIARAAQTLIAHGRLTALIGWIEALPEDLLRGRPRLRLYQGWALHLSGQTEAGEQILQDTRVALQTEASSPESEALRGQLAALLTGIATLREDTAAVIQEAREALACLPDEDRISRARVYMALGTAYAYEDRADDAARTWRRARDLALEAGNAFLATAAIEMLAGTQIYQQGRLRAAAESLRRVLDLGTAEDGTRLPFTGTAHALLAEIYLEWNDLEAAAGTLDQGIKLLRKGGIRYSLIHTFCAKARLERAVGNAEGALQALQTAEQALGARTMWHMVLQLASCQVRVRLWLGDVEAAARWAEGDPAVIRREMPGTLPLYLRGVGRISLTRVQLARGETEQALATLEGLADEAEAGGRLAQAIETCLLEALAWQAQGVSAAALSSLERALAWAEPEGYVQLFVETGESGAALLHQAASRGVCQEYVKRLLAALEPSHHGRAAGIPSHPHPPTLTEPLTPRELEILTLIRDGYTNRQIAETLFVTLNTVKKHTSNIYGKLGVNSRTQAVARARALGLL
jgi:LuxR family maltose regulon positive regulatory protein